MRYSINIVVLLGLSGYAADMRDLIAEAENGDRRCKEAIDVFCYRVKKYISSYIGALNGVDAIIFTGGIGENSPQIRSQILSEMDRLGIQMDENLNDSVPENKKVNSEESGVDVYVIPTNEELVIAIDSAKIATAAKQTPWA